MGLDRIEVVLPDHQYAIHVGAGVLDQVGAIVSPPAAGRAAALVADETTGRLFAPRVLASLEAGGWKPTLLTVPPGEASKSLDVAGRLLCELADAGLDRGSTLFALGGGVVGDLGGFVAATYMRGIDFVTLPTTLLAQVDSSIGGKVGVDLPQGKNLAGAFHQPVAVVTDPVALESLARPQLLAGLGEVIKHAAIADDGLFRELESLGAVVLEMRGGELEAIVARNCRIKADVVSRDPHERTGLRATLNYGHTIGHAIELGAEAWGLLHGQAIGLGMIAEARAAVGLGFSAPGVADRLAALLTRLGMPLSINRIEVDVDLALRALRADKKVVGGVLSLPVVPEIGRAEVREDVGLDQVEGALLGVLD